MQVSVCKFSNSAKLVLEQSISYVQSPITINWCSRSTTEKIYCYVLNPLAIRMNAEVVSLLLSLFTFISKQLQLQRILNFSWVILTLFEKFALTWIHMCQTNQPIPSKQNGLIWTSPNILQPHHPESSPVAPVLSLWLASQFVSG